MQENINDTAIKKRKQKKSILDPFKNEVEYLYNIGVTLPNIARIVNQKTPIELTTTAYRNFIQTRIETNKD